MECRYNAGRLEKNASKGQAIMFVAVFQGLERM